MRPHASVLALCMVLLLSVVAAGGTGDLRIIDASKRGDGPAVRTLLQERVDVNVAQPDGTTALHWASHRNDFELVDLLLRQGARADVENRLGVTPLFLACQNGSAAVVERLLRGGASPNRTSLANRVTPVMIAARVGSVGAVEALLAHGAHVNAKETAREQTALMWAAAQNHPDIVRVLVQAGADVQARSALSRGLASRGASRKKGTPMDQEIVEMTLGGFTPLLFAARQGDVESLRILLTAGANIDDPAPDGATPLVVAAHSNQGKAAAFLLEKGAAANASEAGYTALLAAVLRGDPDLVKTLLAYGANPNAPLTKGSMIKRLSKEFSFNEAWVGATPLFMAAQFAEAEIMRLLIDGGGDPLFRLRGSTLLMAAAGVGVGSDRRGRMLDPAEIDLALLQNEDERTVMGSGLKAVRLALEAGVDVNLANEAGDTALHGAASRGFNSVAQLLVEKGAKLDARNKRGQTPLASAIARDHQSTADLLRRLGAME